METLPNGLVLAACTAQDLINYAQPSTDLEVRLLELLEELQADKDDLLLHADDIEDLRSQIAALERKQGELEEQVSSLEDTISYHDVEIRNLESTVDELQEKLDELNSNHNKE